MGKEKTEMLEWQITASSGMHGGQSCDFGIKGKLHDRGCALLIIMVSLQGRECPENRKLF